MLFSRTQHRSSLQRVLIHPIRLLSTVAISLALLPPCQLQPAETTIHISDPMSPPTWALLQRELLRSHLPACKEYFARYFDERGYLECVERWGGADGPDDAIEAVNHWPILHLLGGSDEIYEMYSKAWEGHLRQYTEAKTTHVPFARDGMYYKEFPVMMDWVHNGEGLIMFNLKGLSDPNPANFQKRVRRFAGLYLGEDPGAPNYDPEHKIIRSMFNGSRGPLMRNTTSVDWAGDPIEIKHRFRRGDRSYEEMLARFKDYVDIIGDHPQNLLATSLALNAYMLAHENKYKDWLLEYVDAWVERTRSNDNLIPSKIGLDGKIGGPEGKWYSGVYGWGFSVVIPRNGVVAHRNTHYMAIMGFGNAFLLTGNQRYVDVWRNLLAAVNANGKLVDGKLMVPRMYGDDGWYAYEEGLYDFGTRWIYYWSMDRRDLESVPKDDWFAFLEGQDPDFPVRALQADFETIRHRVQESRADPTTPDTRISDNVDDYNPVTTDTLLKLMLGGMPPRFGGPLHCRVRYFDPKNTRPGLPADVAALVQKMTAEETTLTLVNVSPTTARTLIVQGGAYGEHQCNEVAISGQIVRIDQPFFKVTLAPGAGTQMVIRMRRYANQPTLMRPWDRNRAIDQ